MFRQAVITVRKSKGDGTFENLAVLNIPFRQPFNNFGLGLEFSFTKTYTDPTSVCNLVIHNPDDTIVDSFNYDTRKIKNRPLVEIRAGYSSFKQKTNTEIDNLKRDLSLIYSGFPFYFSDDKIIGGRTLTVDLSDKLSFNQFGRITQGFGKGTRIYTVIETILTRINQSFNLNKLKNNSDFAKLTLENTVYYNARGVLYDILPQLGRQYRFWYFYNNEGVLEFELGNVAPEPAPPISVGTATGLIEHPTGINFTQYRIKTFFARPKIFYPGEWMRAESNVFSGGILDGLVVESEFEFNDESAICNYIVSAEGRPVNTHPIIEI